MPSSMLSHFRFRAAFFFAIIFIFHSLTPDIAFSFSADICRFYFAIFAASAFDFADYFLFDISSFTLLIFRLFSFLHFHYFLRCRHALIFSFDISPFCHFHFAMPLILFRFRCRHAFILAIFAADGSFFDSFRFSMPAFIDIFFHDFTLFSLLFITSPH